MQWLQATNTADWTTVALPIAVSNVSAFASTEYTDGASISELNPTVVKSFNKTSDKYTSVTLARYYGVGYKMSLIITGFDL